MEQIDEQGVPIQHYLCAGHLLFLRLSRGAADRARDAHAGEI
jgi:hypothetical protein